MRVINRRIERNCTRLKDIKFGRVVQFESVFNSNYPPTEIFVVVDPGSYYGGSLDFPRAKTCVMSLTFGKLSFVDSQRKCVEMEAEVSVNGPRM